MPSSVLVRTFTDPDELTTEIRHSLIERTITRPGNFAAKFHRVDLHKLWLQHFAETLPRTAHVYTGPGRIAVGFRTSPGPVIVRRGTEINSDIAILVRPDQSFYHILTGPASYAGISSPIAEFEALGEATLGRNPEALEEFHKPAPEVLAKLQRLHAAARNLAEDAPAVLAYPEAARGLEQALIEGMMGCLDDNAADDDRRARRQHAAIMRRFHRAIEEHADEPLYIPELCKEIGTSLRTLNACCQEHLGMGPKHYLLLRRINLFRQALRTGSPAETTVTATATRYGFWQFGRLAVEYRALFGEMPSATLARPV